MDLIIGSLVVMSMTDDKVRYFQMNII